MKSVVINPFFDWADDRPLRDPLQRDGDLRGARQGHDDAAPGHPGRRARHLRGPGAPGDDRALPAAGRDRRRADAGAPVRARLDAGRARACPTTGATTPSASSPRTTTTPASARAASRCRSSRRWSGTLHRAGIEVILDVVYNHTAEGNHLGPTLSFRGIDNQAYYRLVDGDAQLLLRHHRHRQQPQRPPPRVAAADHGLAAVLGHRDARRRVPVRPGLRAGPGVPRGRPAGRVLRPGQPGPDRQPGQADRRAVGRRRGRLPGRRLPAAVDGVERQVPRHRARLLARRAGQPRGVRRRGSPARRTCTRPTTAAPSRRSTSSPRTTGSPCTTWSPTTTSTTRPTARTTATARATTGRGTTASEGPTDDAEIDALRERQKRNFLATLLLSQGVPMIAHGDELGRTQQRQQQRLLPGQRAELGRLGRRPRQRRCSPSSPRSLAALRAAHPIFRRQRFFQGRPIQGSSIDDIAWLRPDGRHDGRRRLARRARAEPRGLPQRRRHPRPRRARRARRRRLVPAAVQRRPPADHLHAARRDLRARPGRSSSTPPTRCSPTPAAATRGPAASSGSRRARRWCCSAPPSARRNTLRR